MNAIKRFQRPFWSLVSYQIKEYPLPYLLGFLCLIGTHYVQSELPFLARTLVQNSGLTYKEMWIFFLMAIGIIFFRTSSRVLFFTPARLLQRELRKELLTEISLTSPFRYRHLNQGELFQYLTGDIEQIRALIGFVGLQLGNIIIAFFILVPRLMDFHPELIYTLIPMGICFCLFTIVVSKNRDDFKHMQKAQGDLQNNIIEAYQGKKTIKNFHAEEKFVDLFKTSSLFELTFFARTSRGISFSLPLVALGVGLSLVWGAIIIYQNKMKPEDFVLFSGFIFLFMEPINYLSWIGMVVSRSFASWKRLTDFYQLLQRPVDVEAELNVVTEQAGIKVPFWQHHLTCDFQKGHWTVFVGATGVGKSELLERIAQILILQKKTLSFTFQDPYIFNDSIKSNIFLGKEPNQLEIDRAKKYLKIFGLDYVEPDLDKLLNLEVGENGKRLSGGQAKRLQLVRSLVSNAEYIIWDDPFSSIDLILEKEILTQLKNDEYLKMKKFILSSHRLSTVKYADQIIYLNKEIGIVESGNIADLLQPGTAVYEYFKLQMV